MKLRFYAFLIFTVILLMLSSYYFTYLESINLGFSDFKSYTLISVHGISSYADNNIPLQHVERWVFYTLLGQVSYLTSIDLWLIYRLFILMIISLSIGVIMKQDFISNLGKVASTFFIVFNPYLFRLYLASPGAICDAMFVFGILLISIGFYGSKNWYINIGIILCCLSRQTAIMLIPIIGFYAYKVKVNRKHLVYMFLLILIIIIINRIVVRHYLHSSSSNYIIHHLMGIFDFFIYHFNFNQFFEFFGRLMVFVLTIFPLIRLAKFNLDFKYYVLFFIFIGIQPILGGPITTGPNIQRLLALGIPFLLPLLWAYSFSCKTVLIFITLQFFISLHHHFSVLYYLEISKYWFLGMLLFTAVLSLGLFKQAELENEI